MCSEDIDNMSFKGFGFGIGFISVSQVCFLCGTSNVIYFIFAIGQTQRHSQK